MIKSKFQSAIEGVGKKQFEHWKADREGRLATIILCDQFSRNCYRGSPEAFSFDSIALSVAKDIYKNPNVWKDYMYAEKIFILMPLMHSENKADQETCLNAFKHLKKQAEAEGNSEMAGMLAMNIKSAEEHKEAIDKFGRYPTRNQVLGRQTTPEEAKYLKTAEGWGQ